MVFLLDSVALRHKAGGSVTTNVQMREMDLHLADVVADGLDGTARRQGAHGREGDVEVAPHEGGPELAAEETRAREVVLAAGAGGRWSTEAAVFASSSMLVNSTPHTQFFCTWLKFWSPALDRIVGLQFLRLLKVFPFPTCFTAPCLTYICLHTSLHRFLHLDLVRLPLLRCSPLQGGLCIGRLAEQFPLTGYEPKSVIEISSEHTPTNSPSREGSLDTNLDDLVNSVDASEIYDTTDMGRLTPPLFSQEREVSANPFYVSSSRTHSSVEKYMVHIDPYSSVERSMRDVGTFSTFGKPLSKGKRNRELESVQDSQMARERSLSEGRCS